MPRKCPICRKRPLPRGKSFCNKRCYRKACRSGKCGPQPDPTLTEIWEIRTKEIQAEWSAREERSRRLAVPRVVVSTARNHMERQHG